MTNRPGDAPDASEMDSGAAGPSMSIPDGGLGAAMPEWMRETPSWKRVPEPPQVRSIPEPDTSVIDPRRLIDVDDLPEWLQAVAARETAERSTASHLPDARQTWPSAPRGETARSESVDVPVVDRPWPAPPDAAMRLPAERSHRSNQQHVRLTPSPSPVARPWWMSDIAVAVLFVAIILTLIYVALVASDVV